MGDKIFRSGSIKQTAFQYLTLHQLAGHHYINKIFIGDKIINSVKS